MILVWVTGIGVASAAFTWTRLRRLAELPIRHLWLVWVALGVQLVLFEYLGRRIPLPVSDKIHLGTYALALAFLWLNRRLPGGWLIAHRHQLQPRRDRRQRWLDAGQHDRVAQGGHARDPARGLRELTCVVVATTGDPGRRLLRTGVVAVVERVQHR